MEFQLKAFDSVQRETLRNIMKHYHGIPDKITRLVQNLYNSQCAVFTRNGTVTSERFEVKSGVKQGCYKSGFFFPLTVDWIQQKITCRNKMALDIQA
jgi:hypothetical protein